MGSKLGMAFGASLIVTALIVACGGADGADVLGAPGPVESSSGTSGVGTSGTSGDIGTSGTSGVGTSGTSGVGTSGASTTSSTSSTGGPPDCLCQAPPAGCVLNTPNPAPGKCDCSYRCPDAGGSVKCTWSKTDPCPSGYYCDAQSCGAGFCVAKGKDEKQDRGPQCGCDGVTYWNSTIASKSGMAIRSAGACVDGAAKCGGLVSLACPAGASCNRAVKNKTQCTVVEGQGTCWRMPTQCSAIIVGGKSRACGTNGTCSDECKAIVSQTQWFEDGSCPN